MTILFTAHDFAYFPVSFGALASMSFRTAVPAFFAEGESPEPPFVCYLLPQSDNFAADGMVYFKASGVKIELYTDTKDPSVEKKLEDDKRTRPHRNCSARRWGPGKGKRRRASQRACQRNQGPVGGKETGGRAG